MFLVTYGLTAQDPGQLQNLSACIKYGTNFTFSFILASAVFGWFLTAYLESLQSAFTYTGI